MEYKIIGPAEPGQRSLGGVGVVTLHPTSVFPQDDVGQYQINHDRDNGSHLLDDPNQVVDILRCRESVLPQLSVHGADVIADLQHHRNEVDEVGFAQCVVWLAHGLGVEIERRPQTVEQLER